MLCACGRSPPITHTPPLPARCAKDRCLVLAGTQSGKELVRYPRRMDGHRAQGAPWVKKLHDQPGSCLSHSNPGANKAEGTAGVTAPPLEVLLPPEHPLSFQLSHPLSHLFLSFVLSFFLALSIAFSAILLRSFYPPSFLFPHSPPFPSSLSVTLSAFLTSLPRPCARSVLGFEFLNVFFYSPSFDHSLSMMQEE